jgi:hypothetical protein
VECDEHADLREGNSWRFPLHASVIFYSLISGDLLIAECNIRVVD